MSYSNTDILLDLAKQVRTPFYDLDMAEKIIQWSKVGDPNNPRLKFAESLINVYTFLYQTKYLEDHRDLFEKEILDMGRTLSDKILRHHQKENSKEVVE